MSDSFFHFKEFTLKNQSAAFRINTDGVMLGAWADLSSDRTILDIGTGTGVIAHICHYKNRNAQVVAIDIDQESCNEAIYNVVHNDIGSYISILHVDAIDHVYDEGYDHIISNPPYFSGSSLPKDNKLKFSKHSTHLSISKFWRSVSRLSHQQSKISIIVPYHDLTSQYQEAALYGWRISRLTEVSNTEMSPPIRALVEFKKSDAEKTISQLHIYEQCGIKQSKSFIELHKDFYL